MDGPRTRPRVQRRVTCAGVVILASHRETDHALAARCDGQRRNDQIITRQCQGALIDDTSGYAVNVHLGIDHVPGDPGLGGAADADRRVDGAPELPVGVGDLRHARINTF